MGNATNGVHAYGPYLRRDYPGGSFGTCCIMYDPNNSLGNPRATDEAYLLRTGFYEHYVDSGGWQAYGCPTRDEYHPESGAPNDAIQFFLRRAVGDIPFHYMYYEAALPVGHQIRWHSSYTTDWVSQTPGGVTNMAQGTSQTFTVRFQNTGTTTWYNNPTAYPYDYISLKSTDPQGNAAVSLLNSPYRANLGWLDEQTPCTMQESAVPPGDTATFTFTGRVANDQTLGLMLVYFRPHHSLAGLLPGWDGMHFQVNVTPATPDPMADVSVLYDYGGCETRVHAFVSTGGSFAHQGNPGWITLNDYCLSQVKRSLTGDFDGDGFSDVAMLYQYAECEVGIHTILATGWSFTYEPSWWESDAYCVYAIEGSAAGDFNGDGRDDIAVVYNYGGCETRIHVLLSTGSGFAYQGNDGWWIGGGWYCAEQVRFTNAGDLNADGKDDLVLAYSYGGATTALHAFLSTGASFAYQGQWFYADWFSLDAVKFMEAGDLNADGRADVVMAYRYGSNETALITFLSSGSGFAYQGWWWHVDYFSLDAAPFMQVGDIDGDGRADAAIAYRYGEYSSAIHCFLSNGSAFTYAPYWWQGTGFGWDFTNTFALGKFNGVGMPKRAGGELQIPLPQSFQLAQNYPNPFNPATTIAYALPSAAHVTLEVYNILGQRVARLVNARQQAGDYTVPFDASDLPSGVYLYRLHTDSATETRKMLILK